MYISNKELLKIKKNIENFFHKNYFRNNLYEKNGKIRFRTEKERTESLMKVADNMTKEFFDIFLDWNIFISEGWISWDNKIIDTLMYKLTMKIIDRRLNNG